MGTLQAEHTCKVWCTPGVRPRMLHEMGVLNLICCPTLSFKKPLGNSVGIGFKSPHIWLLFLAHSPGLQEPSPNPGAMLLSGRGQGVNENSPSEHHMIKKPAKLLLQSPACHYLGAKLGKSIHLLNNISSDLPGFSNTRLNYSGLLSKTY